MVAKKWYLSKTICTNAALLVVFAIGLLVQAAGVYHLSPEIVAGLGMVAAVVNFWLRLQTAAPIADTPAAVAAGAEPPSE